MAVTVTVCNSFKHELLAGVHNMSTDVYKVALFNGTALGAGTTAYSASGEVATSGDYNSAGGVSLTPTVSSTGATAFFGFADKALANTTITATQALVYNSSKSNKAVCVIDFGGSQSSSNGTFTIDFPATDAANALVRF